MKKLFLMGFVALGLASCVSDKEVTPLTPTELLAQKQEAYNNAFVQTFGNIASNQNWGFSSGMRSAYTNGNMWEDDGYTIPSPITEEELAKVLAVFNEVGEESYESLIDMDCFFVQQVYKGTAHYTAGNNADVLGADHMDWLVAYDPVGTDETVYLPENNYQASIVKNHDDHVNDFNNSYSNDYDGCMLMVNSSTQRFGFRSSEDSQMHYTFRMEEIDGNYYVGLDFVATGANPNQQVARDRIYNDWIVKIVPGKGTSDKVKQEGLIICEDLGTIGDFDFNDVVFYAKVWQSGKTEIWLLAAGGTLNLTVAGQEVHEAFGVSQSTMVNTKESTGKGADKEIFHFVANDKYNSLIDIPVIVRSKDAAGNVTSYELSAEMGKAPQKICVPKGFRWCKEYKSLSDVYPGFKDWTTGEASTWAGEYDASNVVDDVEYNF
ncbi:MAG: hypothetical protein IJ633_04515 [Prevotella sp.]|nr:hypothetical protein [Prevotella sp.]